MRHPYSDLLARVRKPARYLGGEPGQVRKGWDGVDVRMCLAFPDLYDLGMSHLGTKILYRLLNDHPRILAERAFMPWDDLEAELQTRGLPLVSLESARPLCDFDVVGFSLQFELTYTNLLAMLDLGRIPLRTAARRAADPLVIAGGPCATHPEPLAPFVDAFLVGEAEEELPETLLRIARWRAEGRPREEVLRRLAARGGWYAPSLYDVEEDPATGLLVVGAPRHPDVPARVRRRVVDDLDRFPFPPDSPLAATEAVFDRVSVELARGCTEGCRFCQAGVVYRPVRERDPEAVLTALEAAVDHGGYDQASLSSLSPADYSAIGPLIGEAGRRLHARGVSVAVSSLRAYGLTGDVLDDLRALNTGGLTFAPEAGTQRLRDVISKNVTDEDIDTSAERIFSRGWSRAKLYFMLGLPTEEDDDVLGIVATGRRVRAIGHRCLGRRPPDVTCSVSSFVPKPHTPFQWAEFGPLERIEHRQALLRRAVRRTRLKLKTHGRDGSWLEAVTARGDRRLADAIEAAWRRGCRFDGWEGLLRWDDWQAALAEAGVEPERSLSALPVDARLPWSHIDVGVEPGFLAREWRRSQKGRASPPCGKPAGLLVHPASVEEAAADTRPLVCYQCGLSCDLDALREGRIERLRTLGALRPPPPRAEPPQPPPRGRPRPTPRAQTGERVRYRLRYAKVGRSAWIGHLDLVRELPRVVRRAGFVPWLSRGFRPRPLLTFGPALPLGWPAAAELVDVSLAEAPDADELVRRLATAAPEGLVPLAARRLEPGEARLSRVLAVADYALVPDVASLAEAGGPEALAEAFRRGAEAAPPVRWTRKERAREAAWAEAVAGWGVSETADLPPRLGLPEGSLALTVRLRLGDIVPRATEVVATALGLADPPEPEVVCRTGLWALDESGQTVDPMEAGAPPSGTREKDPDA